MSEIKHTPEPLFLMNGMRFKLSFHDICCDECGAENNRVTIEPLGMYANELNGKWVALVPADNDRHLDLLRLEKQRDELAETINAVAALCTYRHESKEDFIGRVRAALGDDPELRISEVRRQRDELLAAQQELLDALDHQISDPDRLFRAKNASRAAIARAKGGAA